MERIFFQVIRVFDSIDSTNEEAKRLCRRGYGEGTIVTARLQTRGKGRQGRQWMSPPDAGLYATLTFQDKKIPGYPLLCQALVSLAAIETLEIMVGSGLIFSLKWPNDIMLNEYKIAGILSETFSAESQSFVIVGLGINVNNKTEELPVKTKIKASSLFIETGRLFNIRKMLNILVENTEKRLVNLTKDKTYELSEEWKSRQYLMQKNVLMVAKNVKFEGRVVDVDIKNGIIIESTDNERRTFVNGDIFLV